MQKHEFKQGYNEGRAKSVSMEGWQKACILAVGIIIIGCAVLLI